MINPSENINEKHASKEGPDITPHQMLTSSFPYPLQLDAKKEYEVSLLSMETYNTLFNITEKNDKFSYNPDHRK